MLQKYKSTPAPEVDAPARWPDSSGLVRATDKPTLVVLLHPRCPCSRATVHELNVLMTHMGNRLTLHALFVRPPGVPADWEKSELWQSAAAIPGATLTVDEGGREARLFHATTSGQTVLFDAAGKRIFAGGLTVARGHEGDSPGLRRIESLLVRGTSDLATAPVFGCELANPTARKPTQLATRTLSRGDTQPP